MPEPNIDLLKINSDFFEELFYKILIYLIDKNKSNNLYYYQISENYLRYLDTNQNYSCCAKSMYEYFDNYYCKFYNYEWIITRIKDYGNYPENYNFMCSYDELKYNMRYIVEFIIYEFEKYTTITRYT
jgi:hypothetical protein